MSEISIIAQIIIAVSIVYVWIFRFDNIVIEFRQYGLNDLTRSMIGGTKIALATLLVAGIWYPSLVFIPALLMGLLMLCAQYFHYKVKNPIQKRLPSFFLLLLCILIALIAKNIL